VAARLLQVVVFPYRSCSFTAITRVQIPSGTPTKIKDLFETPFFPFDKIVCEITCLFQNPYSWAAMFCDKSGTAPISTALFPSSAARTTTLPHGVHAYLCTYDSM